MISSQDPVCGRNSLITFDDSITSNRVMAEEVLNPMGIRTVFFVVSELVGMEDRRLIVEQVALTVARRRFQFVYSGVRGDNSQDVSSFFLRRSSAELQDLQLHYTSFSNRHRSAFLEGAADRHYAQFRSSLDAWTRRQC